MVGRVTERLFVALSLAPEIRMAIDAWRLELALPGRPVPAGNLHVTLRFIGDVDEVGRDRVLALLDQTETPDPFVMHIGDVGAFPNPSKATVAWASVDAGRPLAQLAEAVDDAVAGAGFGYEDRPFHPHLTLSRIRPPRDLSQVDAAHRPGVKIEVDRFVLYRSRFGPDGVRYEGVEQFLL